ncbi:hypothetical protein MCHI_000461 [Candidatus Magnetoovum chiemensis]|nr:hypothetical protein MCHI_000461 [Candidatus Magnetoovum chiemensis]
MDAIKWFLNKYAVFEEDNFMLEIVKKYVVDENNNRLAVEIYIETFKKIEDILEDYGLYHLMTDDMKAESLSLEQAKEYYRLETQ